MFHLVFDNGEDRDFDVGPYMATGVFRALRDRSEFAKVRVFLGSVAWPGGQDLCPDTLYEESVPRKRVARAGRRRARRTAVRAESDCPPSVSQKPGIMAE